MVFLPVCSEDQETIYPNKCQAECADYHMMMNSFLSLLTVVTLVPLAHSLSTVTPACAHCQPPTFPPGGRVFLPVCSEDQETIYPNKCQAECAGVTPVPCT